MKFSNTLKNALCLSLITAFSLSAIPKRAEAIVGLAITDAPLAIAGAVVIAGSAAVQTYAYISDKQQDAQHIDTWGDLGSSFALLFTIPGGILGLVLLDGKAGQTIEYRELNAAGAAALGVEAADMVAYNANLSKINDALRSVEFDLAQQTNPTLDDSRAAWDNYDAAIPAGAMSVVAKISAKALQK